MRLQFLLGALAGIVVALGSASLPAHEAPQRLAAAPVTAPAVTAGPTRSGVTPSARVGRVSLIAGKVEFRSPGESQWSAVSVNDPVATGVAVRTDPQARAEIRIGADTIDLDAGTEIAVAKLDRPIAEIAVKQGRIDVDVGRFEADESVQIDIPRGAMWLRQTGRYDVDAGGGGRPARLAAYTGGARFAGGGIDILIEAGDRVMLNPSGSIDPMTEPASGDEFAEWCGARAVDDLQLAAPYFVSREMTGYTALDAAGSWRRSDKYGEVWAPKAPPAEWAPYRNGHWRWLAPWGWSWVDDQPWGFATSHYGRWVVIDGKWAWAPGKLTAHPIWAPAVVAFLGTPGVGLSYADGPGPAIAWFPLAPGEIYWPSYTGDIDYIQAVNRSNVADLSAIRIRKDGEPPADIVNAHFSNREFASVVPRPVFVAGQPVATALITIPDQRLRDAPAIMGSPQIGAPPPAPVRVATAPLVSLRLPPPPLAMILQRSPSWASIVRAATIRSQHYQEFARLRFVRLPAVLAYAETPRLRHMLVLRVARADHVPSHPEMRKRMIRR